MTPGASTWLAPLFLSQRTRKIRQTPAVSTQLYWKDGTMKATFYLPLQPTRKPVNSVASSTSFSNSNTIKHIWGKGFVKTEEDSVCPFPQHSVLLESYPPPSSLLRIFHCIFFVKKWNNLAHLLRGSLGCGVSMN